jgi:hypothetical protein
MSDLCLCMLCITLPLIGPHKKRLHIIGQKNNCVTDLKNVTLLDYGGAVTWRHLVLDSEEQSGIRPPTKRYNCFKCYYRDGGE